MSRSWKWDFSESLQQEPSCPVFSVSEISEILRPVVCKLFCGDLRFLDTGRRETVFFLPLVLNNSQVVKFQ